VAEDNEKFLTETRAESAETELRPFSPDEMVRCEACLRANPPTRFNCFYCGAKLTPSDAPSASLRKPVMRRPEIWEEGFNLIFGGAPNLREEVLSEAANLLRLGPDEVGRIVERGVPLPLARTDSQEEALLVEAKLRALGLSVETISDTELMARDEGRRRVRAFDFEDEELAAHAAGGQEVWRARWSELSLMVTGRLILRKVELEERKGRVGGSEMVDAREILAGDVLLLDLYTNEKGGGWRLASDSFDFSCLGGRKGLVAAQNFSTLVQVIRERAPQLIIDESYDTLRQELAPVWPPEERRESRGLRRERPGRFHTEAVMTTDNEMQFTRYSRLRRWLKLRQSGSLNAE
jgi:hypothetical protein